MELRKIFNKYEEKKKKKKLDQTVNNKKVTLS